MSSTRAPSGCGDRERRVAAERDGPGAHDEADLHRRLAGGRAWARVETWEGGLAQPKTTAATAAHASLRRSTAEIAKLELDPEVLASERRDDGL